MKLLISPAKSLEFDKALPTQQTTVPVFQNDAGYINSVLKKNSVEDLGKLMHLSEKLALLNWDRNQAFSTDSTQSRAAVYAFNGDVYTGLDAYTLEEDKIGQMQKMLRILSGLYGVLKPLDVIRAYRLEMGTTLKLGAFENLYAFWKEKISSQLQTARVILDLDGGFGKEQCPADIETIADLQKLDGILLKRGYTSEDIERIFSKNGLRFLNENLRD